MQIRTNEPNLPSYSNVVDILNDGLVEVITRLAAVKQYTPIPLAASVPTMVLPADVGEIIKLAWSTSPTPSTSGAIVYPLIDNAIGQFFDQTGNTPNTGGGIPTFFTQYIDSAGLITVQFWPVPSQAGYIFCYYKQRPSLWATGTDAPSQASTTNLDPQFQDAVIWYAAMVCAYNVEAFDKAERFEKKFESLIETYKERVMKRQAPKGSIVRETRGSPFDPRPAWMR